MDYNFFLNNRSKEVVTCCHSEQAHLLEDLGLKHMFTLQIIIWSQIKYEGDYNLLSFEEFLLNNKKLYKSKNYTTFQINNLIKKYKS